MELLSIVEQLANSTRHDKSDELMKELAEFERKRQSLPLKTAADVEARCEYNGINVVH